MNKNQLIKIREVVIALVFLLFVFCLGFSSDVFGELLEMLTESDAYMNGNLASQNTNYCNPAIVYVVNGALSDNVGICGFGDLDTLSSDIILDSAFVRGYVTVVTGGDCSLSIGLRPITDYCANVTWNDWINPDSEWNDGGADMASNDSGWSPRDGQGDKGADRELTVQSTLNITSNGFKYWDLDTAVIRKVIDDDYAELVCIFKPGTDADLHILGKGDIVDPMNRLRLYVYYHEASSGNSRRRRMLLGE